MNTVIKLNEQSYDLGDGRYSPFMGELAKDLYRLTEHEAGLCVAVAKSVGGEVGRLNFVVKAIAVGKVGAKNGQATVKSVSDALKDVVMTPALKLVRALGLIDKLEFVETPLPKFTFKSEIEQWITKHTPVEPLVEESE